MKVKKINKPFGRTNITELSKRLREAERKLKEKEQIFDMLESNTRDMLWCFDLSSMKLTYISPSVLKLRGYTQEEALQQTMSQALSPESLFYLQKVMAEYMDDPDRYAKQDYENKLYYVEQPCKDGSKIWTEAKIRIFTDENGEIKVFGCSRNYKQQGDELTEIYRLLGKEEMFLYSVMDAAPCAIGCVSKNGHILFRNQRYADALNIDKGDSTSHIQDILPEHLRERHLAFFNTCLQGSDVSFLEKDAFPHQPQLEYVYGVYNPFFNTRGEVEYVVIVMINITDQKRMEQQLAEAQKKAGMGSCEWNFQQEKLLCSDGLLILFDVTEKEIEEESYQALLKKIHPDDQVQLEMIIDKLLQNKISRQQIEFRIVRDNRETRMFQAEGSILYNTDNMPGKIVWSCIDITEHRRLAEMQQEAVNRMREFARTIPDVGFIATEDGEIVERLGNKDYWSENKPVRNLKTAIARHDINPFFDSIRYAFMHKTVQFGEYTINTAIGQRTFEVRIAPMSYIVDGKRTVACYAVDATGKKQGHKFLLLSYEKRRQQEILNDLIEGRVLPSQSVLDQAWRVSLNLTQPLSCYLLQVSEWQNQPPEYWTEKQKTYDYFIDSLVAILKGETGAIVWKCKKGICVLHPLEINHRDTKQCELFTAEKLKKCITLNFPEVVIIIGIAEFHNDTFYNLAKVYGQACDALNYGPSLLERENIYHYLDLGIFQILPQLSDRDKLYSFVNRILGALIEYDRKKNSQLVNTLQMLLLTDNINSTAEKLFVHPKTIAFRKKRIESILGLSIDQLDNKTTINMALKLHKLFPQN